jgi:hypothetical protein
LKQKKIKNKCEFNKTFYLSLLASLLLSLPKLLIGLEEKDLVPYKLKYQEEIMGNVPFICYTILYVT